MKKALPYIFIVLILVNLFAPFSVALQKDNTIDVQKNKAEASGVTLHAETFSNDSSVGVNVTVTWADTGWRTTETVVMEVKNATTGQEVLPPTQIPLQNKPGAATQTGAPTGTTTAVTQTGTLPAPHLNPSTTYTVTLAAIQSTKTWTSIVTTIVAGDLSDWVLNKAGITDPDISTASRTYTVSTLAAGQKNAVSQGTVDAVSADTLMPPCTISSWTIGGCIGQLLYYGLFLPTSFIFALTGKFFDWTFAYSVNDTSYRSSFVVQGWGIVRDFCNLFFIFVLLYIAFATILNLHGFKTKEMVINVVIIGLLINFSLFTTQVIIDTSNILARVFYNSDAIKITQGSGAANCVTSGGSGCIAGSGTVTPGPNGEIQLSAALVNKVNPQNLLINASKVGALNDTTGAGTGAVSSGGISASTFILVTLLATAVNVVGLIVFLAVGLIFITRVIGLWFSMIFVPFAFFSYMVPGLNNFDTIGWKKWWPETLKMAFLAPVFIFFLYLILKFLNVGLDLINANGRTGIDFVVATTIPFIFIMVLLWKAKSLASDMSGKLGQSITGGIAAVGSLALGGAALGTAALGRSTIGSFMKGASTGETAAARIRAERTSGNRDPYLTRFQRLRGNLSIASGIDRAQRAVGGRLNANQHEIEHAAHARHDLDTAAGVVAPGKKWSELNGEQRDLVRRNLERTVEMRAQNLGRMTWAQLNPAQQQRITTAINPRLQNHTTAADNTDPNNMGIIPASRRKVGLRENLVQSTVGGSFDVRNLSKIVAGEQDKALNKLVTGLTSFLAGGMRGAFKQVGFNYGTGQKDFIKDLGNTITDALKSTVIKVDISHVGEEAKEDLHGGGGHH